MHNIKLFLESLGDQLFDPIAVTRVGGFIGGLPATTTDEVDILSLWLRLYPGDMRQHLAEMNAAGLRIDHRFKVSLSLSGSDFGV